MEHLPKKRHIGSIKLRSIETKIKSRKKIKQDDTIDMCLNCSAENCKGYCDKVRTKK